ncbi:MULTISPECIES: ABC transporter permease [Methylobacterium]|uniref:Glycine betaine uptake system permease protein YehW n=1 Tax=Methylobacterium thuringiense TaxID=1003091 RepID=A0ABQ4THV5_9HYPH|nr:MULTISPECIES: ABC transporter permease subunit [Methylobacterium]TXN23818.1 ABC transporter permease subunit [Methylobacterium sp. WL9]GJE54107.1 Glycine betaine uptake system permease protein YehW [Methylobacterium thuringiense]
MNLLHRLRPAVWPLVVGLALVVLSHPVSAETIAGLLGGSARRPLSSARLIELGSHHLALAGTGLALVGSLGVGLGILATRRSASGLRSGIDTTAAIMQAVPPVVVVALALPVLGFGAPPTLLALVAYGIMPTLRGTVGAIEAVSSEAQEAGIAIGLTPRQILTKIELPLAGAGILDALRVALVLSIATAAVGALAGASTLGTPIVAGLQNQNLVPMLQGAGATAALAFVGDALMLAIAGLLRR